MVMTPAEQRDALIKQLDDRTPGVLKSMRYDEGNHDMPAVQESIKEQQRRKNRWAEFTRLLAVSRVNFMATVVDAVAERARISGFRFGDPTTSADPQPMNTAWSIWQANKLDAVSTLMIRDALVCSASYGLIWPAPDMSPPVRITNEHALQCIVSYDPETRQRAAGLKMWADVDGTKFATLFTPEFVHKWSQAAPTLNSPKAREWVIREIPGEEWPLLNPMGVVPLVEVAPRPQTLGAGRSELFGLIDTQDRINLTLFGRMLAAWTNGIRQRYGTGLTIDVDEETGETKSPFELAIDGLIYNEDPNGRFGEFSAVDLRPFIEAVQADLMALAVQSNTPYQLLVSGGNVPNGESYKANTNGLVSKVRERCKHMGEAFEEIIRVALIAIDDPASLDQQTEVEWENPEYRTEGELVDALVKMRTLGVPREVLWRRWGASPQEVQAWKEMALQESFTDPGTPPTVSSGAV